MLEEGAGRGGGAQCGTNQGECSAGVNRCVSGVLTCQGAIGPAGAEVWEAELRERQLVAETIVKKYLEGKPRFEVRMDYARVLLDAQRYAESAEQLQHITSEKPDYSPAWLVRGSLEFHGGS